MIENTLSGAEDKMSKSVDSFKRELLRIRTGRATPGLLEGIRVDYYGNEVPLNQTASISIPEPRTIAIQPWDKSMISKIEKAILKSELGITPVSDGNFVRLTVPLLTEERRRDLTKMIRKIAEEARVSVRNIRREANEHLKRDEKSSEITEDESKRGQQKVQELTDKYIEAIDKLLAEKEREIMEGQ